MLRAAATLSLTASAAAWNDIAGALTYKGTSHVFQGCPGGGQPGSSAHGWHHAASEDLVHWEDRGIHVEAIKESYKGFSSDTSPCSGFVTVDDEGVPCAGFRQCGSITGLTGLNPKANKWDAPLEIRCAKNANLTDWGEPEYLFPVYFYRGLPYDPTRPWKDKDGKWYATISTDGCNATTRKAPCQAGGRLDLWTSPKLHGAGMDWKYVGPMVTTPKTPIDSSAAHEFVTSGYFGSIPGDPKGGKTRVVTNNDCNGGATNMGTPIYYLGTQENGGTFTDAAGKQEFAGAGEIGMLDWGAYTPNKVAGKKGVEALSGGKGRGYSMARTLGSDPNQVAVAGRRTVVAWVSAAFTSQSLLQDITLGTDGGAGDVITLRQTFVPELTILRTGAPMAVLSTAATTGSLHFELVATVKKPAAGGPVGVSVLASKDGASKAKIVVDFVSGLVMVDGTTAGNSDIRAGPLLGDTDEVTIHAYVDHSIIAVIFNNRTSLTVSVKPSAEDSTGVATIGAGVTATVHKLNAANQNAGAIENPEYLNVHYNASDPSTHILGGAPKEAWLLPKIHNSPACLSGRKPSFPLSK